MCNIQTSKRVRVPFAMMKSLACGGCDDALYFMDARFTNTYATHTHTDTDTAIYILHLQCSPRKMRDCAL